MLGANFNEDKTVQFMPTLHGKAVCTKENIRKGK
jgi:hypothetical protein